MSVPLTVGFWCQGIAQKFFRTFDTSFDTKMMVKSGAIEIIFKSHEPFQSYLLTGLAKRLVSPGQLAGNVEFESNFDGTTFQHHFCMKNGVRCPVEFLFYSLAPKTYSVLR